MISKTPGVCGGSACIHGTRIPVWTVANHRWNHGDSVKEMLEAWPHLTAAQLQEALEYADKNRREIKSEIWENTL